jgi:hypothetical protein
LTDTDTHSGGKSAERRGGGHPAQPWIDDGMPAGLIKPPTLVPCARGD